MVNMYSKALSTETVRKREEAEAKAKLDRDAEFNRRVKAEAERAEVERRDAKVELPKVSEKMGLSLKEAVTELQGLIDLQPAEYGYKYGFADWFAAKIENRKIQLAIMIADTHLKHAEQLKPLGICPECGRQNLKYRQKVCFDCEGS